MTGDESPPQPAATSLAPGFRFHPTDEELVSYYLKRKVLSKPFAVDAISDVDLYKVEPWDLPAKSRLQSRDMEWYFFGSLDKKYSNRSKTNRATGQGYWKTTGKDRAVRRGPRVVGMKKTLVFHLGRAPKGERTNWVMHEYRLEDEDLEKAGVLQDAYVVCRIFRKNGPGPQNGAQYGAPFVEAEWEDDEKVVVGWGNGGGNMLMDSENQEHSEEQGQHADIHNENATYQVGSDNEQDIVVIADCAVKPNSLSLPIPQDEGTSDSNEDICLPEPHRDSGFAPSQSVDVLGSPQSSPIDDFLELNDFIQPLDVEEFDLMVPPVIQNDEAYLFDSATNLQDLHEVEEFFNSVEDDIPVRKQEVPALPKDNFYRDKNTIFNINASGVQAKDAMLYFNMPSFVELTDVTEPMSSGFPLSDPLDELAAYFDAADNPNQDHPMDYSEFLDFPTNSWDKDDGDVKPDVLLSPQVSDTNNLSVSGIGQKGINAVKPIESPGMEYVYTPDKSIKGRLISMLGSISSPPALAAEPKVQDLKPAASSIHITAGMIHLNQVNGTGQPWFVQKGEDLGFLLSYDSTKADLRHDSSGFPQVGKMQCNSVSFAICSRYCHSLLSLLFLALIFKIGIYIYAR